MPDWRICRTWVKKVCTQQQPFHERGQKGRTILAGAAAQDWHTCVRQAAAAATCRQQSRLRPLYVLTCAGHGSVYCMQAVWTQHVPQTPAHAA